MFVLVWYALLCVLSSFAIILTRKRERESWLPHGTVGWSTVSLYFLIILTYFLYSEFLKYSIQILMVLAVEAILNYFKQYCKDSTVYKSLNVPLAFTLRVAIMTQYSSRINPLQIK